MNGFIFGFSATLLSTMLWPSLPPVGLLPYFLLGTVILWQKSPLCAGGLFAVFWLTLFCFGLSKHDFTDLSQPIQIKGEIITLVNQNSDWLSLDIAIIRPNLALGPKAKLRLTWKTPPALQVGQIWSFTLMPKSMSNVLNQGSYNEQKQLVSQHIIGKGRVLQAELVSDNASLRNQLVASLAPLLAPMAQGDILLALILGDNRLISKERWQLLRQTGTGHLVSISGLHLSVLTVWIYTCSLWLCNRFALVPSRRNLIVALILSACSAIFYAYLAGFGVATQRALIMIVLLMLLSLLRRFSSAWERLLFALFVVLLIDPLSCLSPGFWLSFCALAIILYTLEVAPKVPVKGVEPSMVMGLKVSLLQFWSVQWRLTLVLGVIQAVLFGGMSVHSLWMNMLVVPWFSMVVIPLAMVGFGCWWLGSVLGFSWLGILQLSDLALAPYGQLLQLSTHLPAHWQATSASELAAGICALLAGVLWCFIPKTRQYRLWHLVSSVLWMPLLWTLVLKMLPIASPAWAVHVLDVGQGLAVVIEKEGRGMLYDTGAAFGDEFSYSQRVILPFLNAKGIQHIDYVFISHSDNDHAGGAQVLARTYPKAEWISDVPHLAAKGCRPQQFVWQSLTVTILFPKQPTDGNNGSCVVRIDDGEHSLLLTGDIEKAAEAALLLEIPLLATPLTPLGAPPQSHTDAGASLLTSQVLLAPHHGSKTSSTGAFIDAVAPELVIFAAGLANRFGFPKAEVIERYQQRQIAHLITGYEGQISVVFTPGQRKVKSYRRDLAPFWYNRVFRFGDLLNPE